MEIKIREKKESPLLYRIEMVADLVSESITPSKEELKKKCASLLNTNENLIVVKKIMTCFGSRNAKAIIYQYKDEKKLKSIEPKEKKKVKEAKKAKTEEKKEESQR